MTEKTDEESILGSLPATRPTRFGRDRAKASGGGTATATKAKPKATATATKAKPKPKAAAKSRTRPKPKAAPRAVKPDAAHGPRPVRAGSPSLAEPTRRA